MADLPAVSRNGHVQRPHLVSFIGTTNAGKSSLIKALIERHAAPRGGVMSAFRVPVVGSPVHDSVPTSGDVHLYADPLTFAEDGPIFFADCEGLEGGERSPIGSQSCRRRFSWEPADSRAKGQSRWLEWARTEETRRREFAVSVLYPRILYAFSDCVVFVLRNAKTFQSAALTKLLEWAAGASERSMNRAARPHCIVALNASDVGVDSDEWDVQRATDTLLASVRHALDPLEGVPRFRMLADRWRQLGRTVATVEDLLLCFYSSFRVVRIPSTPHYRAIDDQVHKLYDVLRDDCRRSLEAKSCARMHFTADQQHFYLSRCFDHFAAHLDTAFNFSQVSLMHSPVSEGFERHALELILQAGRRPQPNECNDNICAIFRGLSALFASYILLDCVRSHKTDAAEASQSYISILQQVFEEYRDFHHPCSYRSEDGRRSCQLVRARHRTKCHQDSKGVIGEGEYSSGMDDNFMGEWCQGIRATVDALNQTLSWRAEHAVPDRAVTTEQVTGITLDMHLVQVNRVFEAFGPPGDVRSTTTCFGCLMRDPEHVLPCGHVLCDTCMRAHGTRQRYAVSLYCCPLHRKEPPWAEPALVPCRPAGCGIRALSLDGGGIRGIVQLEILRAIEGALDDLIPVQSLFDLVVGTGTGGLIAATLSLRDASVGRCMDTLYTICENAYAPRAARAAFAGPLTQSLGTLIPYRTDRLDAALRATFTRQAEFFGPPGQFARKTRVAITANAIGRRGPLLLANYRRDDANGAGYTLARGSPEMKTWECVRATLARSSHFRSFAACGRVFSGTPVESANPAAIADADARLLCPDRTAPDVLLSLGTGQDRRRVLNKLTQHRRHTENATGASRGRSQRRRPGRTNEIVAAEVQWQSFKSHAAKRLSRSEYDRLVRLNPDLGHAVPSADDRGGMRTLQSLTRDKLAEPHRLAAVRSVAHRLLAATFFIETRLQSDDDRERRLYRCSIACRFPDGSAELRALGSLLQRKHTEGFVPRFVVRPESTSSRDEIRIAITSAKTAQMREVAVFRGFDFVLHSSDFRSTSSIHLVLTAHDAVHPDGYPISGFPRRITKTWLVACLQPEAEDCVEQETDRHLSSVGTFQAAKTNQVHEISAWNEFLDRDATDSGAASRSSIDDPFHLDGTRDCSSEASAEVNEMDDSADGRSISLDTSSARLSSREVRHRSRSTLESIYHERLPGERASGSAHHGKGGAVFEQAAAERVGQNPRASASGTSVGADGVGTEVCEDDKHGTSSDSEISDATMERQGQRQAVGAGPARKDRRNSLDSILSYFENMLPSRAEM